MDEWCQAELQQQSLLSFHTNGYGKRQRNVRRVRLSTVALSEICRLNIELLISYISN